MPGKKHKPEATNGKLRKVVIVLGKGRATVEEGRWIAISEQALLPLAQGILWPEDGSSASDEGFGERERQALKVRQ